MKKDPLLWTSNWPVHLSIQVYLVEFPEHRSSPPLGSWEWDFDERTSWFKLGPTGMATSAE